ncbi:MAG: hypothetical protein AAB423_03035 [Patescibacteria group bacterium]
MVLIAHILLALSSILFSTYVLFNPSRSKIYSSYSLIASTLTTGVYLTLIHPAHIKQACISGVVYIATMSAIMISVHARLEKTTN